MAVKSCENETNSEAVEAIHVLVFYTYYTCSTPYMFPCAGKISHIGANFQSKRLSARLLLHSFPCLSKPRTRKGTNIHTDVLELCIRLCSHFVEKLSNVASRMKRRRGLIAFH